MHVHILQMVDILLTCVKDYQVKTILNDETTYTKQLKVQKSAWRCGNGARYCRMPHTNTVVQEWCKGDEGSQWKKPHFDL